VKTVTMPTLRTRESIRCCDWLFARICYNFLEGGLVALDSLLTLFPHPHAVCCVLSSQTFLRRGVESDSDSESSDG
jgi:hypothetical protein